MKAVPRLDPETPATLFRSRAHWPSERASAPLEEIGGGPLAVMVRIVLSDPDAEYWPYRILADGHSFEGKAIVTLGARLQSHDDR